MSLAAMTLYRRLVLAVALVASAGYPVGQWFASAGDGVLGEVSSFGFLAVVVMLLVLLIVTFLAERPAVFIVRPEESSFSAPPSFQALVITVTFTVSASRAAGSLVVSVKSHDLRLWNAVLVVVWIVGSGVLLARAWRGLGVHLRPEGLRWRELTGSVSVPWEALAPGHPLRPAIRASNLVLLYARPKLVRRRGLVMGQQLVCIDNVDAWFIADAIRHYVTHPNVGQRSARRSNTAASSTRPARN